MARRRTKKRTHVGARNGPSTSNSTSASMNRAPKSMVIRVGAGEVGPSVSQLVKDVRSMMEPETASRLKERKSNRLRDYTTMAGPLGVSHLLLFSRSTSGNTNMRLALTPRGPTLHFRIEKYSLCKDVKKALKHPKGGGKEYLKPPLLVMNNFTSPPPADGTKAPVPKHLESLTTSVFQSLFPPISPQTTPLPSIRRVLLLNREPVSSGSKNPSADAYTINLRHYAITTRRTNLSRRIRRLQPTSSLPHSLSQTQSKAKAKGALPNLSHLPDISDYLLSQNDGAYTSASETEPDTDAEVEVLDVSARKILQRKKQSQAATAGTSSKATEGSTAAPATEKRAIHLHELGPRLKLRLTKVEEGVCNGKVLWNAFVAKSESEVKELDEKWQVRNSEKEERRRIQKERVEEKKKKSGGKRGAGKGEGDGMDVDGAEEEDEDLDDEEEWDSEGFEDDDGEDEDEEEEE